MVVWTSLTVRRGLQVMEKKASNLTLKFTANTSMVAMLSHI